VVDGGYEGVTQSRNKGDSPARCPSRDRLSQPGWYDGEPYGDGWDDSLGDFHPFGSLCAHPGCEDAAETPYYVERDTGRPVKPQGGRAVYCHYHASPMWVKRRQRAKAKSV
jgi:hypothetical protein